MIIEKPWGWEKIWAKTDKYVGKILHINAGESLSLQFHRIKEETILVKKGRLILTHNDTVHILSPGESFHIKPNDVHRMEAGNRDVEVIEVSTPELDDVVRLSDRYGRTEPECGAV